MGIKIAMLGLPGAGKGTQSKKLSEEYGMPAFGMGDILRGNADAVIQYDDEDAEARDLYRVGDAVVYTDEPDKLPDDLETIGERLAAGEGPSTDTSTYFLEQEIDEADDGYVIDGFPRWGEQAEAMDSIDDLDAIVYLSVPHDTIYERALEGDRDRDDDTREGLQRRIQWQTEGLAEVFDHYDWGHGDVPIETVDGDQSIDDVWDDVDDIAEKYLQE